MTPCACVIYGAVAMKPGSFRLSSAFVKGRNKIRLFVPRKRTTEEKGREGNQIMTLPAARTRPPRRTDDVDEIPRPFFISRVTGKLDAELEEAT